MKLARIGSRCPLNKAGIINKENAGTVHQAHAARLAKFIPKQTSTRVETADEGHIPLAGSFTSLRIPSDGMARQGVPEVNRPRCRRSSALPYPDVQSRNVFSGTKFPV